MQKTIAHNIKSTPEDFYKDKISNYSHADNIKNPNAKLFFQNFAKDPTMPRQELARMSEVTKQTVYHWITKIVENKSLNSRGKPRKYLNGELSVAMTLRLPESYLPMLKKIAKKKGVTVRSILESVILDNSELKSERANYKCKRSK